MTAHEKGLPWKGLSLYQEKAFEDVFIEKHFFCGHLKAHLSGTSRENHHMHCD
jgi:hypothetical protein